MFPLVCVLMLIGRVDGVFGADVPQGENVETTAAVAADKGVVSSEVKPSSEFVRQAWELSTQGKLDELDRLTEQGLAVYAEKAKALQAPLTEFPPTTQQDDYKILNDVGTLLFIRAEALMNYGRTEEAIAAFQSLIEEYPWARSWDPRGWFWSVREKSQDSIKVMVGKVEEDEEEHEPDRLKTLPTLAFPGKKQVVDYRKFGQFHTVGTTEYHYKVHDPKGLAEAVG